MAFNLNGFNVNHSVLDASGRPVLTYADIINRAHLVAQLISAIMCDRRSATLSSSTRRTGMQMQWSGGLTRCSPGCVDLSTLVQGYACLSF